VITTENAAGAGVSADVGGTVGAVVAGAGVGATSGEETDFGELEPPVAAGLALESRGGADASGLAEDPPDEAVTGAPADCDPPPAATLIGVAEAPAMPPGAGPHTPPPTVASTSAAASAAALIPAMAE
jgi:hypothetical protein